MRWAGIVTVLLLAAFFALLALGHTVQVHDGRDLWAHGKVAEGTITEQFSRKRNCCEYTYTFDAGGRVVTAERRSITSAAGSLPVGSKVVVRYDSADPGSSVTAAELETLENWGNRALLPGIALALLGWAAHLFATRHRKGHPESNRPASPT